MNFDYITAMPYMYMRFTHNIFGIFMPIWNLDTFFLHGVAMLCEKCVQDSNVLYPGCELRVSYE